MSAEGDAAAGGRASGPGSGVAAGREASGPVRGGASGFESGAGVGGERRGPGARAGSSITVRGVWKFFGDFAALRDINLEVPAGATLALLGRNGAGKTTLLRMLGALGSPSRGTITLGGETLRDSAQRRRIGAIGHAIWIYDDLTAAENLRFFAALYGIRAAEAQIGQWLEKTGLERVRDRLAREFSRGMRQRLAIARAFFHDPEILLLDEPFTALDDRAAALLSGLIGQAHARGCTAIISTHQLREALALATEVAVLDRGRLAFRGPNTEELRAAPEDFYRKYTEPGA
ncbi:MAG TPA: ABC transporter ATP-binding protein [Bryobacterales bacterium]|nr:ABC transporter ATP-binding protein [Bryobacterales bacterium]